MALVAPTGFVGSSKKTLSPSLAGCLVASSLSLSEPRQVASVMNEKGLPLSPSMSVVVFAHGIVMGRSYTVEWTHEVLGSHDMNLHGCLPM